MILRFVEHWQYHEIASARSIPIGTVTVASFQLQEEARGVLESARPQTEISRNEAA